MHVCEWTHPIPKHGFCLSLHPNKKSTFQFSAHLFILFYFCFTFNSDHSSFHAQNRFICKCTMISVMVPQNYSLCLSASETITMNDFFSTTWALWQQFADVYELAHYCLVGNTDVMKIEIKSNYFVRKSHCKQTYRILLIKINKFDEDWSYHVNHSMANHEKEHGTMG